MKRSPLKYEKIAGSLSRHKPYHLPTVTSPKSATRCAAHGFWSAESSSDEMDIMRLASRNVKNRTMTKRFTFHSLDDDPHETSSVDSKQVKVIHPVNYSAPSSTCSETSFDYDDVEYLDDNESGTNQSTQRKEGSSETKGNHYTLSKIVDYLQTRTLASYFKNPTEEDRMKSSRLANVTKSLMAASVVHLGGKHDRHSDSYLRGLRRGLSYASDKHDDQQVEGGASEGKTWPEKRGKRGSNVSRDLREVYYQDGKHTGEKQRRLSLSRCRKKKEKRESIMRPHKGDDDHRNMRSGVQLCSLAELEQLEALDRLCRARKLERATATRRQRPDISAYRKPNGGGKRRRLRGEWEGASRSRSRSRKRSSYEPGVTSMATRSTRTRKRKWGAKKPKKNGGRLKRH